MKGESEEVIDLTVDSDDSDSQEYRLSFRLENVKPNEKHQAHNHQELTAQQKNAHMKKDVQRWIAELQSEFPSRK